MKRSRVLVDAHELSSGCGMDLYVDSSLKDEPRDLARGLA